MTTLESPPQDHAPRVASSDIDAFLVPTGREEEWRFAPMDAVRPFLDLDPNAGTLIAPSTEHVRIVPGVEATGSGWLPTDRASAVARQGASRAVLVDVPAEQVLDEPIVIELTGTPGVANYGHLEIRLGRHAKATVVVVHDASVDASGAMVATVGDGADLTMLSIIDGPAERVQLWQWHTVVGRDARMTGSAITIGGRVVRVVPSVEFSGPGASVELLGAFLAEGEQYLEHRIFVDHDQPHCTSNVVYKGALSGAGAHTVWVGDVLVRREATGTDTYELNRNLLLDDGPRADSVPNLELETGDVASAGHASATGRFDDEQLFYLQSRGIPEALARQLVVRGFFVDVLSRIPSVAWQQHVLERISARLGMAPTTEEDA